MSGRCNEKHNGDDLVEQGNRDNNKPTFQATATRSKEIACSHQNRTNSGLFLAWKN
jgi:hypothetical protein